MSEREAELQRYLNIINLYIKNPVDLKTLTIEVAKLIEQRDAAQKQVAELKAQYQAAININVDEMCYVDDYWRQQLADRDRLIERAKLFAGQHHTKHGFQAECICLGCLWLADAKAIGK